MAAGKTPDQVAKSLGFPSAAAMTAWQNKQNEIANMPAQTMSPAQHPAPQVQGTGHPWLDAIINMLPLGNAMNKARA